LRRNGVNPAGRKSNRNQPQTNPAAIPERDKAARNAMNTFKDYPQDKHSLSTFPLTLCEWHEIYTVLWLLSAGLIVAAGGMAGVL
jgi:hypothetical protein